MPESVVLSVIAMIVMVIAPSSVVARREMVHHPNQRLPRLEPRVVTLVRHGVAMPLMASGTMHRARSSQSKRRLLKLIMIRTVGPTKTLDCPLNMFLQFHFCV